MRIIISGICGHMGQELYHLTLDPSRTVEAVCGIDAAPSFGMPVQVYKTFDEVGEKTDCIVDFSHHSATAALTAFAVETNTPLVIATTGQTDEEKKMIEEASKSVPVFFAANFSIGVALLCSLAKKTAAVMNDAEIEIVETHHDRKLDAPSGTALAIADAIKEARPGAETVCGRSGHAKRKSEEIGISSVRIGNVVGIHEVLIGNGNETITLKHEAHSRALFASGALVAARFVADKTPGLYTMKDMIKL